VHTRFYFSLYVFSKKKCHLCNKLLFKKKKHKRFWTRKWLKKRYFGRGLSSLFFEELAVKYKKSFKNFPKMSIRTFDDLLAKVGPKICRQNTTFKECISLRIRLLLTLRYLATGETFQRLHFGFRISVPSTVYPRIEFTRGKKIIIFDFRQKLQKNNI
jgi:hypothetical protein